MSEKRPCFGHMNDPLEVKHLADGRPMLVDTRNCFACKDAGGCRVATDFAVENAVLRSRLADAQAELKACGETMLESQKAMKLGLAAKEILERHIAERDAELAAMREALEFKFPVPCRMCSVETEEGQCSDKCDELNRWNQADAKRNAALSQPHAKAAYERWGKMERFVNAAIALDDSNWLITHAAFEDIQRHMPEREATVKEYKEALAALRGEVEK